MSIDKKQLSERFLRVASDALDKMGEIDAMTPDWPGDHVARIRQEARIGLVTIAAKAVKAAGSLVQRDDFSSIVEMCKPLVARAIGGPMGIVPPPGQPREGSELGDIGRYLRALETVERAARDVSAAPRSEGPYAGVASDEQGQALKRLADALDAMHLVDGMSDRLPFTLKGD
jgi:hypothetical protein